MISLYTTRGISVERIHFDSNYWEHTLLPKLKRFFEDCLTPKIVSPVHSVALPIRDLSKMV